MTEVAGLEPGLALSLTEDLIRVELFQSQLDRAAFLRDPRNLPPATISERRVMMHAALAILTQHWDPTDRPLPTGREIQDASRAHAADLRLIGRQLIVIKNLEDFVGGRTPPEGMEEAAESGQDVFGRILTFFQTHQPKEGESASSPTFDLLSKQGAVLSPTITHQDTVMATLLLKVGMGQPASDKYPAPLKAMIVTPTERDTFRHAYRRTGNSTFRHVAPGLDLMTTQRQKQLINDPGSRIVVTSPDVLADLLVSGRMTITKFDLILTDGMSPDERGTIQSLIHAQQVGPVVVSFGLLSTEQNRVEAA